MSKGAKKKLIGIIGGMGPKAGIVFQQYILDATPAKIDQDHLRVITYTNPSVPDRTAAILAEETKDVEDAIVESGKILVSAGATIIAIPCHTAHAMHVNIAKRLAVPVIDMISITLNVIPLSKRKIGLLATDGTIHSRAYDGHKKAVKKEWVFPTQADQEKVMDALYAIKAGEEKRSSEIISKIGQSLLEQGAEILILGCTELSVVADKLTISKNDMIDPLRVMANLLVSQHRAY